MTQQGKNPTSIHEDAGTIPSLTQWVRGSIIAVSCGVGHSLGLDLALLWLWRRLAAIALIRPLSLGTPTCHRCGHKKQKNIYIFDWVTMLYSRN